MRHYRYKLRYTKEMMSLPKSIKLISLIIFIYYIGWGIVSPYFPIFLKDILGDYTSVGLVTGLLPLFAVFVYLVAGALADKISKKKIISFMLLMYLPFSYILLALGTLVSFVYFRIYHAAIATSLWTATDSYVREHSPRGKEAEAIGLFDSTYTISLIIGPIIGAFLITAYGYSMFYSISLFALAAFIVSFRLPATRGKRVFRGLRELVKEHFIKKEISDFIANKELMKLSFFMFFFYFGTSIIGMTVPLFLRSMGTDFFRIGIIAALFNIPWVFESYFSITSKKRRSVLAGLVFATVFLFLLFLTNFFTGSLTMIAFILLFLGISIAAVLPIIQGRLTSLMPKKEIGELVGVNSSIWNIATGFGPIIAGVLADKFGLGYLFLTVALLFLILFFVAYSSKSFYFVESRIMDGAQKL